MPDVDTLLKDFERERNARIEVESILEQKKILLQDATITLTNFQNSFAEQLKAKIETIEALARFSKEDPNPLLRFSLTGELLYFNAASQALLTHLPVTTKEDDFWKLYIKEAQETKHIIEVEVYIEQSVLLLLFTPVTNIDYINVYSQDISEIKKIQNQLEASEFRYRYIIENAGDIFFRINKNGDFTYVNQVIEHLTGYSAEEFTRMNFMQLVRDDYRESTFNFYKQQLIDKTPSTYLEFPMLTKSGTELWIGQNVRINTLENNKELSAVARDITERIKSDQKLLRASSRFTALMENLQAGILLEDENRTIILINQTFRDIFSVKTIHTLDGENSLQRVKDYKDFFKDPGVAINRIVEILEKREQVIAEQVLFFDGSIYERDYIPIYSEGNYMGHLWKYQDVTAHIKSSNILKQSEEKYKTIIAKMGLGLLEVDNENKILWANERFCEITTYDLNNELKGKAVADTLLTESGKPMLDIQSTTSLTGRAVMQEIKMKRKNGASFWMLSGVTLLYDENRKVSGKIGTYLDITNQKKTEEALVRAKEKAETSTRAKETFLANMSYEVKTPMNAIVGMSALLANTQADSKQKGYIDTIKSASTNLLTIINDILDFSKIETGKLLLKALPFDLHQALKKLIASLGGKAAEKNILLDLDIDGNIHGALIGDVERLSQVLLNLINNSLKFTNQGSIKLKCELIKDHDNRNEILFKVIDTGIGIDADKLETIFQSFTQEDENINRKYGGTGLGLSISKELINLMGGTIDVTSAKGKGSTFAFAVSFSKGVMVHETTQQTHQEEEKLTGVKILLAEDNQINQFLAITILHRWEAEVDIANNGKEAVALMQEKHYDIVLMDIQMPEMGGVEAAAIIRKQLKLNTPIMALTANALTGDKEKYLEAGMDDYVSKPFDQKMLFKKISALLTLGTITTVLRDGTAKANATPQPEETEDLYDLTQILEIAGGDKNFIRKMITIFIDQIPQLVNRVNQGYADKNWEQVKAFSHQMKPSIDTMHIRSLRKEIRLIEEYADKGINLDQLPALIKQLNTVMERVIAQLQKEIS